MSAACVFDVQRFSLHDGPGIRTTVFFKGCNLRCLWCHNPESQLPAPELMFYNERCVGCGACRASCGKAFTAACLRCGACAGACPNGAREQTGNIREAAELANAALRDLPFYKTSGGGVTLSGGEPLLQTEAALEILSLCKAGGAHTAVETAGNVPKNVFEALLPVTDLFLFDLKGIDEKTHVANTGVGNRRILENARWLSSRAQVRFRMPYVPGYNDGEAPAVAAFAKSCGAPLELMAYHNIGAGKYAALGRACETAGVTPPQPQEMQGLALSLGALYEPSGF